MQNHANIKTFEQCVQAGNPVQITYPEVCLTKDGKRLVNPAQNKAHQANLDQEEELVPPNNPAFLYMDIEEWNVRIPLTEQTFDLSYTYIESGGDESVLFSYKRLLRNNVCLGDIGVRLTRSIAEHLPPFSATNPAAVAKIDNFYYYPSQAGSQCYDPKNPQQAALVAQIAGDKSLTQVTADLLAKIITIPKE